MMEFTELHQLNVEFESLNQSRTFTLFSRQKPGLRFPSAYKPVETLQIRAPYGLVVILESKL